MGYPNDGLLQWWNTPGIWNKKGIYYRWHALEGGTLHGWDIEAICNDPDKYVPWIAAAYKDKGNSFAKLNTNARANINDDLDDGCYSCEDELGEEYIMEGDPPHFTEYQGPGTKTDPTKPSYNHDK